MLKMFDHDQPMPSMTMTHYCYSDDRQHEVYVETNEAMRCFKAVVIDVPFFHMPENFDNIGIQVHHTIDTHHSKNGNDAPIKKLEISFNFSENAVTAKQQVDSFKKLISHLNDERHMNNFYTDRTVFFNQALEKFSSVLTGEVTHSAQKDTSHDAYRGANFAF